jgi:hypothetical protein
MIDWLADAFATGHIIDLILVLMVVEAVGLAAYARASGRGLRLSDVGVTLASGVALMLAVRAALVGAGWPWVALALTAALIAHITDLITRWRR